MENRLSHRGWANATRVIALATAILCLTLLWLEMSGESTGSTLLTRFLLGLTALAWFGTAAAGLLRYRAWALSLLAPLVVVATFVVARSGAPAELGWTLSKSALEQAAITCAPTTGTRIGVFHVSTIANREGGCLLYTTGGFMTYSGFAYFPDAAPAPGGDLYYEPFEGPWYHFEESF
ncbi:hypothetical protein [Nocardia yamanashiensis]|uniref:hypothetical protein n=1 Tax=Nocardia yamanashiensis TaxID=209247 RepID=UPI00082D0239|nr:hypothetical protein [Nocardia yamanashiensis]